MSTNKMAEQEEKPKTVEEVTDSLSVLLKLNSEEEWNLSARELMSRLRHADKIKVEIDALVKEYFISCQSVVQAIHEINKKKPTFEIVDNTVNQESKSNDQKK